MKLTKENIVFIDNYLQNSGVFYYDIRLEMLDHVATAVEEKMEEESLDFYEAFKSYMIENKKELMKQNNTEGLNYAALPKFGKFLLRPFQILIFAFSFLVYYLLFQKFEIREIFLNSVYVVLFLVVVVGCYQWFYIGFYKNEQFYAIEQTGGILFLLYQTAYFFRSFLVFKDSQNVTVDYLLIAVYVGLFINYFVYYFSEVLKFKNKNKVLFQ